MSGRMSVLGLLLAAGCGLAEPDFHAARTEAHCAFLIGCYPAVYASAEACVEDWGEAPDRDTCAYDEAAAKACVTELEALACPEDGAIPVLPDACGAVYTDCATGE